MPSDKITGEDSIRIYKGNECMPSSIPTSRFKIPYLDQMRPTVNEASPNVQQKPNRFHNRVDDRLQWFANSSEISRFRNNIPSRQGECIFRFMDSNTTEMGIVHIPNAGVANGFIVPISSISSRVIGSAFDLGLFEYTKELVAGSTEVKYVGKTEQLVVLHGHFEFFIRTRSIPKFFEPDPVTGELKPVNYTGYATLSFAQLRQEGPIKPINSSFWTTLYRVQLGSITDTFKIDPSEWYTEYESGEFIDKDPAVLDRLNTAEWARITMNFHRDVIFEPGMTYGLRLWFWRQYTHINEDGRPQSDGDWPIFLYDGIHLQNASMSFLFDATQDVASFIEDRFSDGV